jgi:homoserine dehydrogenase
MGTGFLQNEPAWRTLPLLPAGESRSPFYFRLSVEDRAGTLARVAEALAQRGVSVARLLQHPDEAGGATLVVVTHDAAAGDVDAALDAIAGLPQVHARPHALPVVA